MVSKYWISNFKGQWCLRDRNKKKEVSHLVAPAYCLENLQVIWEGTQKTQNYLRWGACLVLQASLTRWVSVLGTHLCQCTRWCCHERLCSASVNFFKDSFNVFAHSMMGDLQAHLSIPSWVFSTFWPKTEIPPCPTLPIHPILSQATFFVSLDEKSPQRKIFCQCGRGKTKKWQKH